ncbi:MAG: hypothetical protein V7637_6642 [Mycobacteriales bacterium]|jgi:hypothetical protein
MRREVLLVGGLGGGLTALVYVVLQLASYRAELWFCVAVTVALLSTWRLLVAATPPAPLAGPAGAETELSGAGLDGLSTLAHRLSWGSVDLGRYETRVRPQLARLAEERLRQRHGIDVVGQPDAARRMVGEPLWLLMTGPPSPATPTRSRLAELLTAIEQI